MPRNKKPHSWVITNLHDHLNRTSFYCKHCDANVLTNEDWYKSSLDELGCNSINVDTDDIYHVKVMNDGKLDNISVHLTLSYALVHASAYCWNFNEEDIYIVDVNGKEVDLSSYLL